MRWIREKIFHHSQSEEMDEEVMAETFLEQMAIQFYQQMQAQGMQPPPGGETAPEGEIPGGPAGIMPGARAANMAAGGPTPEGIEGQMAEQERTMQGGNTGLPTARVPQ
jgi:hypothetical protein